MSAKRLQIVIIGDGIAGHTAAQTINKLNPSAKVTLIGAEQVPLYSACALPDYLSGYLKREKVFTPEYKHKKLKLYKGEEAANIDPTAQKVHLGDKEFPYDRLIIATGSRAVVPPVPGADIKGNFTAKTLSDIEAILAWGGKRAVVVGSGAIGIETGIALRDKGLEVTLIEMVDRIMPTAFDPAPSAMLQQQVEAAGVKVLVGEKVTGVKGKEKVTGVTTGSGEIECDLVVWAAGVRPNTALAEQAGIEIGELRGIKVNEEMETNIEHVYACGDCVQVWDQTFGKSCLSLLWASAKEQATVAAANCLGLNRTYPGALDMVIEEIEGMTAVSIGATEDALRNVYEYEDFTVKEQNTEAGYARIIVNSQRILGAQFVGNYQGAGAVAGWMKQGLSPEEIKAVLADREQLKWAPWFANGAYLMELMA